METLLIVCDGLALVGLMIWVLQNQSRGAGPVTGLFRYRVTPRQADVSPSDQTSPTPRGRRMMAKRK